MMAYDAFGNLTNRVDELGHAWATAYDEFNRVVAQTDPLGRATTYSYALPGQGGGCGSCSAQNKPTSITSPSGRRVEMAYDAEWQKIQEIVGAGTAEAATNAFVYDAVGNVVTNIDPRGKVWASAFDNRNRRISASDPLGNTTQWSYDAVGNVMSVVRPDSGVTSNAYDEVNRLVWTRDPKMQVTQFDYDDAGNMTSLTDARNNSYSFTYDLDSRRTSMIYPDSSHEDYTYDAVGNLATYTTRAGQVRTYTYDNRNRETLADWSDSTPDVSKAYDAAGRLTNMTSSVSTLTYAYDAANQLLSETQAVVGQASLPVQYTYDLDGQHLSMTYPDGTIVTNSYTARGQLAAIQNGHPNPLVQYTYDLAGNRLSKTLDNSTLTGYAYDGAGRLLSIVHTNVGQASLLARFDYALNSVGNRTNKSYSGTSFQLVHSEKYFYDAIDQLIGADYYTNAVIERAVSYDYDPVGNRTNVTDNGTPTSYSPNNLNQYTAVGGGNLSYDANGNLTTHAGWTLSYDAQNRLVSATDGTTTTELGYDARNRCVRRKTTIKGAQYFLDPTVYFVYDDWSLIEERDAAGNVLARYYHGATVDELLARATPTGTVYYHQDGLGSAVALTDGTGNVVESYRYDVFGAVSAFDASGFSLPSSAFGNRFTFTGREYLAELGLYDYRNRMYSQVLGRFLQTDPIGFEAQDVNLYRYVGNTVTDAFDPFGLRWCLNREGYNQCVRPYEIYYDAVMAAADWALRQALRFADWEESNCKSTYCSWLPPRLRPACEYGCRLLADTIRAPAYGAHALAYADALAALTCGQALCYVASLYEVPDNCPCMPGDDL
jgi:RHS repeat-associated protein